MVWRSIIFTFCLVQPWPHDQSECTNNSHSKTKFLAEKEFEIKMGLLYSHGDLQTILRFRNYTVNSQLQYHFDKHSNLRTLRE